VVGRDYDTILKTWSAESLALGATQAEAKRILETTPFQSNPIAGTPEQVAEQLQRFVDAGVEYLCLRIVDFPRSEGIELFAQEVIPLLRSR
jgi:alkanesulfonate monooxygenase SsuD/methylene tetrahydromethanopterin reductase-like flavin-dependent oxidoreductase (luciferase family)